MARKTFICRDVRLPGWKPKGGDVLEVDHDTPLSWLITNMEKRAKACEKKKDRLLIKIMCHGLPGFLQCCKGKKRHPQGGNGITAADLPRFAGLNYPKLKLDIELHSCLVARIGPCHETRRSGITVAYDGNYFCFRLAQIAGANVRASIHLQWYGPKDRCAEPGRTMCMDFRGWNGRVFTWDRTGKITSVWDNPRKD